MVNFGMVGLAYRLNMLDQDLKEFIPLTLVAVFLSNMRKQATPLHTQSQK